VLADPATWRDLGWLPAQYVAGIVGPASSVLRIGSLTSGFFRSA
jgi:hypothetical protein